MRFRRLLSALRTGAETRDDDIRDFAAGLATGAVSDAQAGAFAMGVCTRGLSEAGKVALTQAMRDSGDVLTWDLPGPVVDKHSTGGVGDCVSLILAPALAACGAYVPMVSGRGLGHTGGTLDKMEAIPGYRAKVDAQTLRRVVADVGCAIVGATDRIAPADKRLYAIRDISGTVESIDLITASILSKKLAAGLEALILDVKCGSGAFMPDPDSARALAQSLVRTADDAGCPTRALITDMNSPLAASAGNAVEVRDCIAALRGAGGPMVEVTVALGAAALQLAGLAGDAAETRIRTALASGAAAEQFARMVAALGGPHDLIEAPDKYLAQAPVTVPVAGAGTIAAIDTRAVGEIVVDLGGGRAQAEDRIDPAVGLTGLPRVGDTVETLGTVHARSDAAAQQAAHALRAAITFGDAAPAPLILDTVR